MYRPEFAYPPTPSGCADQPCVYSFDASNVPNFSGTIAAGSLITKIPLLLDQDADFYCRAVQLAPTALLVGLEDPGGHPIIFPTLTGLPPTLAVPLWGQCDGGPITALDSDTWGIFCRAGSRFLAYLQNATNGGIAGPVITLHGIKRYKGGACH